MKKISKRGDEVVQENTEVLRQLIDSLEKAEEKLEKAYKKHRYDDFNRLKKFILDTQKGISEKIK